MTNGKNRKPGRDAADVKNPEHEAEYPGGRPTNSVKGSHSGAPRAAGSAEPQGQQGSTTRGN